MTINRHQAGATVAGEKTGGQFKASTKSQASGALLETPKTASMTAAEVREIGFTVDVIRDRFDPEFRYRDRIDDEKGITRIACDLPAWNGGSRIFLVDMNDRGDIVDVQGQYPGGFDTDPGMLDDMQGALRLHRLDAMGVQRQGADNDGGAYGGRFVGSRRAEFDGYVDAAHVSREVRKEVKRATEFGVIPEDAQVRITTDKYAGGQAVRIEVTMPKGRVNTGAEPGHGYQRTAEARSIYTALEAIGNQWNDYESESMTDYYRNDYHLSVQFTEA